MALVGFVVRALATHAVQSVGSAGKERFGPGILPVAGVSATGLTIQYSPELQIALARLRGPLVAQSMANALYRQAERIMTASKRQVPVDTGNLRETGHVEPPKHPLNEHDIAVTLAYGGTAGASVTKHRTEGKGPDKKRVTYYSEGGKVGYAVYVHEDLTVRHRVGNAKYLERPLVEASGDLESRLAKDLRRDIEGAARGW